MNQGNYLNQYPQEIDQNKLKIQEFNKKLEVRNL